MWGRKRQKKPPDRADPDLSDIIPFVTLEHIVLPERLSKSSAETEEESEEEDKRKNVARNFLIVLEQAKKQATEIYKTHK